MVNIFVFLVVLLVFYDSVFYYLKYVIVFDDNKRIVVREFFIVFENTSR